MNKKFLSVVGLSALVLLVGWFDATIFSRHYFDGLSEENLSAVAASAPKNKAGEAPSVNSAYGTIININREINSAVQKKAAGIAIVKPESLKTKVIARRRLMNQLAKARPDFFLSSAISQKVKVGLPADLQKYIETETTVSGKLEVLHIDDFKNPKNSRFDYFINSGGKRTPLYSVVPLNTKANTTIRVSGYATDVGFVASNKRATVLVEAPAPESVGDQKTLVFLVNFPGSDPAPFTRDQARDIIFHGQFQNFFKEQSYNRVSFSGEVYGWINAPTPNNLGLACGQVDLNTPVIRDTISANGVNLANYGRVLFLLNHPSLGGGCSGVGKSSVEVGGSAYNLSTSWSSVGMNQSQHPFNWTSLDYVVSHEIGHALGVQHANGFDCGDRSFDGSDCQHIEYGNSFDTMGNGSRSLHFNAFYKELLGWVNPAETVSVTGSGRYTINPLEASTSVKKLAKIKPLGYTEAPFYVEYRQGIGFDSKLNDPEIAANQHGLFLNAVIRSGSYVFSRLIDLSPTTENWWEDYVLTTLNKNGNPQVFSDPADGLILGPIVNADSAGIEFDVSMTAPVCVRALPLLSFNSSSGGVAAGGSGYIGANFSNNDSLACGPSFFDIVPHVPAGWSYDAYPAPQDVIPMAVNESGYGSINYQVPSTATPGMYDVSMDIVNRSSGYKRVVSGSVRVVAAPVITSVVPSFGLAGTDVLISGSGLEAVGERDGAPNLYFNGQAGYANPEVVTVSDNTLKFTVPSTIIPFSCGGEGDCLPIATPDGMYDLNLYINNYPAQTTFTVSSTSQAAGQPVVTPISQLLKVQANPTDPSDPLLKALFSVKIKAQNGDVYVTDTPGISVSIVNAAPPSYAISKKTTVAKKNVLSKGQALGTGLVSKAPVVTLLDSQNQPKDYYKIAKDEEWQFDLNQSWSTKTMFGGNYYAVIDRLYYRGLLTPRSEYSTYVDLKPIQTPSVVVVGEVSPYITSVVQTSGSEFRVNGLRLTGGSIYVDDVLINDSGRISGTIRSFSTTLSAGKHVLQIKNPAVGDSNIIGFEVTNVSSPAIVVNATTSPLVLGSNYNIAWVTSLIPADYRNRTIFLVDMDGKPAAIIADNATSGWAGLSSFSWKVGMTFNGANTIKPGIYKIRVQYNDAFGDPTMPVSVSGTSVGSITVVQ